MLEILTWLAFPAADELLFAIVDLLELIAPASCDPVLPFPEPG